MKPLARQDGVIVEELAQDYVVFNSRTNKAHNLNQSLYWLWKHCDGTSDLQELTSRFEKHFGAQDASSLVMSGVKQLHEADLLLASEEEDNLAALSAAPVLTRRSLVTRGSAFIPLMSTVMVPAAAAAKSDRGKGKGKGKGKDDKGKGKGKGKQDRNG